jgi:hypothetical protein
MERVKEKIKKRRTERPKKNLALFAILFLPLYNSVFGAILSVIDTAEKNLLDREIFIFKTFHHNLRQTILLA